MTDPEIQPRLVDPPNQTEAPPLAESKPALTIHIHSWGTPIVGLVMLVLGLVAGFYAYPLVEDRLGSQPAAAAVPTSAAAVASDPQPADAEAVAASQAELMEFVVSQTNHFIGDANAPVTLIEFSDFQ